MNDPLRDRDWHETRLNVCGRCDVATVYDDESYPHEFIDLIQPQKYRQQQKKVQHWIDGFYPLIVLAVHLPVTFLCAIVIDIGARRFRSIFYTFIFVAFVIGGQLEDFYDEFKYSARVYVYICSL